jgi:hypothetical protein
MSRKKQAATPRVKLTIEQRMARLDQQKERLKIRKEIEELKKRAKTLR